MKSQLTLRSSDRIAAGHCPDCDHRGFVLGPRGGLAMNIECGNLQCRARFNITIAPMTRQVVFAQRIPKEVDGGTTWYEGSGQ